MITVGHEGFKKYVGEMQIFSFKKNSGIEEIFHEMTSCTCPDDIKAKICSVWKKSF